MQPNNIGNQPAGPAAEAGMASAGAPVNAASAAPKSPDPTFDNGPSVVEGKGGKKTGWIIGLVLMALIAAGGVGFGVWAWMDGNTQKDALNEQISSLKQQNNSLQEQLTELQNTVEEYESSSDEVETETVVVEWGDAKAEVIDGVFYIKDKYDEIVAQNDSVEVVEIVSCDSGTVASPSPLICNVTTADGQGKFIYNYNDGSLSFTATSN